MFIKTNAEWKENKNQDDYANDGNTFCFFPLRYSFCVLFVKHFYFDNFFITRHQFYKNSRKIDKRKKLKKKLNNGEPAKILHFDFDEIRSTGTLEVAREHRIRFCFHEIFLWVSQWESVERNAPFRIEERLKNRFNALLSDF